MEKFITLSSSLREDYNNTSPANCRINLKQSISAKKTRMVSFQCYNTFYNITNINNIIRVNGVNYIVPSGCYSIQNLIDVLIILLGATFTIAYNSIFSRFEIINTAVFTLDFTIQNNIARIMGYEEKFYIAALQQNATYPPKLATNLIYISTNLGSAHITNNNMVHYTFVLNNTSNKMDMILFNNQTNFNLPVLTKIQALNFLDFTFYDENGNILIGLSDWSITLEIC